LDEYKKWLMSLSRKDVFDLMDFTFTKQGFVKGEKIFAKHMEVTGDFNIEDLKIPFTAVATDMKNHEEVHYKEGGLYKALRASVSIPGFIIPVVQNGRVLVDGGVLNPLPVNLVKKADDAIIVAVDLNSSGDGSIEALKKHKNQNESDDDNEKNEVQKWFEKLMPNNLKDHLNNSSNKEDLEEEFSLIELMESTFNFSQDRLASLMLELYKPDMLVKIPRHSASTFDFHKAKEIYDLGKKQYNKARKEMGDDS